MGRKKDAKEKKFHHLTFTDRLALSKMLGTKLSKQEIADALGVHNSSIYREIRRGRYTNLNSDLTTEERYSPDIANQKYKDHLKDKGGGLKIGKDHALANELEHLIADEGLSPEAALGKIEASGKQYSVTLSKQTVYRYIDIDLFQTLTNKQLPSKGKRNGKNKKIRRKPARPPAGESIEHRPKEIESREEFGHWEMDTVMGKQGESEHSLLVLTERKTREEIMRLLYNHTTASVVQRLDELEAEWGEKFRVIFKTITVDNGTEFADCAGMEKSSLHKGRRTKMYYCHPYSSYERGSNENNNKLIRRKIPKGIDFDDKSEEEIAKVERWVNEYPRGIFKHECAAVRFNREIEALFG